MNKKVQKVAALASAMLVAGGTLTGCGKPTTAGGTTFTHKYTQDESQYVLAYQRYGISDITDRVGRITVYDDNTAFIDNVCAYGYFYVSAHATASTTSSGQVEILTKFTTNGNCAARYIVSYPSGSNYFDVAVDVQADCYARFRTK